MSNKLRLFWWNEKYFHNHKKENYGDVLGKYLVEKISKKEVLFSVPKKFKLRDVFHKTYVTIGSVLANVNKNCIVWGSGIIAKDISVENANFIAVRGPETRRYLLAKGYTVPEVYGDPALLLPDYYAPVVEKKYKFGVIPHNYDYELIKELYKDELEFNIISLKTNDIELTTREILACEKIISSSLHGVIVAHAYQIPAVWQKFSDKLFGDNIKFVDYFKSVDIVPYEIEINSNKLTSEKMENLFSQYPHLPKESKITEIKNKLMEVCPFI